ncbi:MAG TPA: hypothetical protein VFU07_05400 [Candidatus Lumbricidophila sp.]|nr:hypothetical protein [Candidatus Lumbricidophila sp.]
MANRTVPAERLREGQTVLATGKLTFSRLTRLIDGQELATRIAKSKSLYPTKLPHTTVSIVDAQVVIKDPTAGPTPEEIFIHESLYSTSTGDYAGRPSYSIDNIGNRLPQIFAKNESGTYNQVTPERELASGLEVTLVLNVYKSKESAKRGIGLAQVLVNEPIRYYGGAGVDTNELAARGIIIEGPVETILAGSAPVGEPAPAFTGFPAGTVVESGFPLPGPAAAPAPALAPAFAAAQPAPAAQPGVETPAEKIARLEAEAAALRAAATGAGSNSPFDTAPAAANPASPWDTPVGVGIQY